MSNNERAPLHDNQYATGSNEYKKFDGVQLRKVVTKHIKEEASNENVLEEYTRTIVVHSNDFSFEGDGFYHNLICKFDQSFKHIQSCELVGCGLPVINNYSSGYEIIIKLKTAPGSYTFKISPGKLTKEKLLGLKKINPVANNTFTLQDFVLIHELKGNIMMELAAGTPLICTDILFSTEDEKPIATKAEGYVHGNKALKFSFMQPIDGLVIDIPEFNDRNLHGISGSTLNNRFAFIPYRSYLNDPQTFTASSINAMVDFVSGKNELRIFKMQFYDINSKPFFFHSSQNAWFRFKIGLKRRKQKTSRFV